jgi:hypothetical protein
MSPAHPGSGASARSASNARSFRRAQAGRGEEPRSGIGRLPLGEMQVMQLVGRDEEPRLAQGLDLSSQLGGQRDRRPHEKAAVREPYESHAGRIGKGEERDGCAVGDPDFRSEGAQPARGFGERLRH